METSVYIVTVTGVAACIGIIVILAAPYIKEWKRRRRYKKPYVSQRLDE